MRTPYSPGPERLPAQGKSKKWLAGVIALTLLFLGYLLWGPGFPWLPATPGYATLRFSRVRVITRDPARLSPAYQHLDDITARLESTHGLRFRKRVNLMVLNNLFELYRFSPWMARAPGAFAYASGDVVLITSKKRLRNSLEEYLAHELSHSLVYQNTARFQGLTLHRQRWVIEGVATCFGGPYYYTENEFRRRLRDVRLTPTASGRDLYGDFPRRDPGFRYTLYRFFIQYLIDRYGQEAFRSFLGLYLAHPRNYPQIFIRVFHQDLPTALRDFEAAYRRPE